MFQNNGIVAYGLGASATSLVLNSFSLGNRKIEVIITPDAGIPPARGGSFTPFIPPRFRPTEETVYDLVTIRITSEDGKVWERQYSVLRKLQPVIVRLFNLINKIINVDISVVMKNIKRITNKFRIK